MAGMELRAGTRACGLPPNAAAQNTDVHWKRAVAMMTTVLSDELLANAERLCLIARLRSLGKLTVYHEEGGSSVPWRDLPIQEKTKWPT